MTALQVNLLTGVLTGSFTLAAGAVTYLIQGRQQRALEQEKRMWDRRAEMYVAMLQYQGSGMAEGDIGAATAREWAVRDELTAKAAAFASDKARDLWQQSALANLALQQYVEEEWPQLTAGEERPEIEAETEKDHKLQGLRQASAQASKQLAGQIRAELGVRRHRRPRRHRGHRQDSLPFSFSGNPSGQLPPARPESLAKPLTEAPQGELR